ncbi:hypothetical protein ACFQ0N_37685 [Paenibacillus sp. GCM10027626]
MKLLPHVSHMVDITDTFEAKMEAMRAYASQCTVVSGALQQIKCKALMRGANVDRGDAHNENLLKLYRNQIHYL